MNYNIIYPFTANIMGPTYNEAVKNFVKQNDLLWKESKHMKLIIQDLNNNNYESKVRFYTEQGRNKVGITSYPISNNFRIPSIVPPFRYPAMAPVVVPPSMPLKMSNMIVPNEYSMRLPIAYTQNIGPYFSM